jgi:hypothetical protein
MAAALLPNMIAVALARLGTAGAVGRHAGQVELADQVAGDDRAVAGPCRLMWGYETSSNSSRYR